MRMRLSAVAILSLSLLLLLSFQNCAPSFSDQDKAQAFSQPFTIVPSTTSETTVAATTAGATSAPLATVKDKCEVTTESGGPTIVSWASPMRMRVYQRQGATADVSVSVGLSGASDCLQARVLNSDQSIVVPWTNVVDGKLRIPNGGWYYVQVRAIANNTAGSVGMLDFVGVGEVFVTAGQSNSTFYGESPQKTASGKVVYFDGAEWQICQDPLKRVDPDAPGGAPWCLLGDMMASAYNVPVAFAPTGWGGTSITQWQKNASGSPGAPGALYARLMQIVQYFGPGGVRAVLWHQGESDVNAMDSWTYATHLLNIVQGTREAVNHPVSWFVSRATYPHDWGSSQAHNWQVISSQGNSARIQVLDAARLQIRAGQEAIVQQDGNGVYYGPDTDLLGTDYRYDGVHFSNYGLSVTAQAWFNVIHPIISRP